MGLFTELAQAARGRRGVRGRLGLHERSGARFPRRAGRAGLLERERRRLRQHAGDRPLPRPRKPSYIGGMLEMANAPPLPLLGPPDRGAAHRASRRTRRRSGGEPLRDPYGDPGALEEFLAAMTGLSPGADRAIAAKFPWDEHATFVDVGAAQGGLAGAVALAHPHLHGRRLRPAGSAPIFEEYVASHGLRDRLTFRRRRLLHRRRSPTRTWSSWATSSTTGTSTRSGCSRQGLRRAARRAAPHRLRGDHRRRPVAERVRAADEPEHADRDAGRLRLHGRRLRRLDGGGRLPRDPRRAPGRAGLDGRRHQVCGWRDSNPQEPKLTRT